MSTFTVKARQQQRTDTSNNWTSLNPILLVGEIGIESNTGKIKVGNGVTAWNSLAYIGITTEFLSANYMSKASPTFTGQMNIGDSNSKIEKNSVSPYGYNIGVMGLMLSHRNGDEGGLLITEDGAYLWNSTDSGSLLKGFDEDLWTSNSNAKITCDFTNGLMFNFDSNGNLKLKGKVFINNGTIEPGSNTTINASNITCTANSALGGYTNLQSILNYLANVLTGNQTVTKIKANTFDTTT